MTIQQRHDDVTETFAVIELIRTMSTRRFYWLMMYTQPGQPLTHVPKCCAGPLAGGICRDPGPGDAGRGRLMGTNNGFFSFIF